MPQQPNPYVILGVRRNARPETIKKAYRDKSKALHPDAGGNPENFAVLNTAYRILSDPDRRRRYDETGDWDEVMPEQPDAFPRQMIAQLLAEILKGPEEPEKFDLADFMRNHFAEKIAEIEQRRGVILRVKERVEKLRGRFKRRDGEGENFMESILTWHIREADLGLAQFDKTIEHMRRAIELLEDYDFDADVPPPQPVRFEWGTATGTDATTTFSF